MKIDKLSDWGVNTDRPVIISGPCSAESEEQMLETAIPLAKAGIKIFRAGIWKPRTRPNSFEGVGSIGLQWMRTVKKETGMLTSTEVASVKHVYEALKMGVDILWVGARTSADPFAVQEIADALKGVDIPVLVKNPVNPDLELWIGALERLSGAGITKLGAIHRGFSTFEKMKYRNNPLWQVPIELRRRLPELPIICDPSHIAGKREYLFELSQKAMDLGAEGLIIESHCNPDVALSDSKQQLVPSDLVDMLHKLVIRNDNTNDMEYKQSLDELRSQIDTIDNELISLLQRRMNISKEIGKHKKANNIQILQTNRWSEIFEKAKQKAKDTDLSVEFIEKTFEAIHEESINIQTKILNS